MWTKERGRSEAASEHERGETKGRYMGCAARMPKGRRRVVIAAIK